RESEHLGGRRADRVVHLPSSEGMARRRQASNGHGGTRQTLSRQISECVRTQERSRPKGVRTPDRRRGGLPCPRRFARTIRDSAGRVGTEEGSWTQERRRKEAQAGRGGRVMRGTMAKIRGVLRALIDTTQS